MNEHNHEHKNETPDSIKDTAGLEGLDASSKSLSDALRISFIVLKVIMVVLVVAFLASGFTTVASDEQAIVLRFGRIHPVGKDRVLGEGLHWILPYPIDQIIKIPTKRAINLKIDSFWYHQTPDEMLKGTTSITERDPLNPILDGYCLTRSQIQAVDEKAADSNTNESDYNIVHTRWQLTYQINNPERFFTNIQLRQLKPGEIYFDVIRQSINPMLNSLFENAVVSTLVNYTIDDAITSRDRIPSDVGQFLQAKLDEINSGIKVLSVQLVDSTCPPQVKAAFEASTKARMLSSADVTKARSDADQLLQETAGPSARQLFESLHNEKETAEHREYLWSQLAGTAKDKISQAQVYATQVEENAKGRAIYLQNILPEYRRRPRLVIQGLYLDAVKEIFSNAQEKFFIQTSEGTNGTEIRVMLNRDATLPAKKEQKKTTE
jgi:modulator of FtsH protease HflK